MRRYLRGVISILLLPSLIAGWVEQAMARGAPPPNIILVYVDDQGWSGTSVQMDMNVSNSKSDFYETPNLMRFASQSMRFSNAYAPSPLCSPSRASIQTGKSPARIGMTNIIREPSYIKKINEDPKKRKKFRQEHLERKLVEPKSISGISKDDITIAEIIKRIKPEYVTGFLGKWHLGSGGPAYHGYDVHDGETWNSNGQLTPPNPKDTFGITDRALEFLTERDRDGRPFFLLVSYYAVHRKVIALDKTIKKYKGLRPGTRHSHTAYAAMTEDLDEGFGRIIDAVNTRTFRERTYIFYMSDNGAYLHNITNNKPLAKGKGTLWEGGIRVPFIVGGPGIEPGSVSDVPVIGWDLFPTFVDLIGEDISLPDGIEGGSLYDLLFDSAEDNDEINRPHGPQLVWHMPHYADSYGVTPHSAIRFGDYKYIEEYEDGKMYLYNLSTDVSESNNLAKKLPRKTEEMKMRLMRYLNEIENSVPESNPDWCWWCFWR